MIKATGTIDGKQLLILGLTEDNVRLLRQDRPILVDMAELNDCRPEKILIVLGRDEKEVARLFRPLIGKDTIVHTEHKNGLES